MVALIRSLVRAFTALTIAPALAMPAQGQTVRGAVGVELRAYPDAPLQSGQDDDRVQPSATLSVNGSGDIGSLRYDVELFGRASADRSRSFVGDVREATIGASGGKLEWKVGMLAETWGVLEAWNPVDIINQRDLSEDFQGKVKFGQLGALATTQAGPLSVTGYVTTMARTRRFAQNEDRLQVLPAPVLHSEFEDGRWTPGGGVRVTGSVAGIDLGVGHYIGPDREPELSPVIDAERFVGLAAKYNRIGQTSLDAQYVTGDAVLKLEVIHRSGDSGGRFWGDGGGLENSFGHPFGLGGELTLYAEYYADGRSDNAPVTPFEHDIFVGARYDFKNISDTVVELRATRDLRWESTLLELRGTRRIAHNLLLQVNLLAPLNAERDPALTTLRRDSYLRVGLSRYF
ncbi:hypothetical protein [Sphingobium sp. EM0848]|uniref:hypothetical protein n=1 Tax=Sphingobium sp. EM0848 TaxID=2743473 RepID=UPI00159C412F|nr:hypothetical protein [Sphingobium sp. EM0848]